jgi:glycosyltransferase involved in cell wall biosynthesis
VLTHAETAGKKLLNSIKYIKSMSKDVLLVFINKKIKNLGGQEKRWLRLASSNLINNRVSCDFIINNHTVEISQKSDAILSDSHIQVKDFSNKIIDYLFKNMLLIYNGAKYNKIYISNQSMYLIPAITLLKIIFGKIILFSYNGNSLMVHKKTNRFVSYFDKIRFISKLSTKIEVLNQNIIDENILPLNKLYMAPCSFSDTEKFKPAEKKKIIVFAGHLVEQKGIHILEKIISNEMAKEYIIKIYGDSVEGDSISIKFKEWLIDFAKTNSNIIYDYKYDMSGVYADAAVFLSLQHDSNYPSQSVIEALYSGCSILLTDTGDSRLFGEFEFMSYIDGPVSVPEIFEKIDRLIVIAAGKKYEIASISRCRHNMSLYANFMIGFLND